MPRYSRLLFKRKYRELLKGGISTDSMRFSKCLTEPVPTTQLACMEIRQEPLHIGFRDLLLAVSAVCWMVTILDDQAGSLLLYWQDCAKISVGPPENWDTTKTCGRGGCCLITLLKITPYPSVSGNARDFSTNLASVSRDLDVKLSKPMPVGRKPLKKLLQINARPYRSTLVRGRSPFSVPQHPDKNVGTDRRTTWRSLALVPSQSGLLRRTQFENRSSSHSGSAHVQCADLRRIYPSSSPINSRQNLPNSGQRQMAQVSRPQVFLRGEQRPYSIGLPTAILSRTQSHRTSLESRAPNGNPQPLFPFDRGASFSFNIPIRYLESTKQYS